MRFTPAEPKPYSVAYFLGAGASFGALPVVKNFCDGIRDVIKELTDRSRHVDSTPAGNLQRAIHDLSLLMAGCKKHSSVDTYARSFWLKKEDEHYEAVKWQICLFFDLWSYFFPKQKELRYDSLLSSIMDRGVRFPKNVSIISWNYDYEIEKAYLPYSGYCVLEDCYNHLAFSHKGVPNRYSRKPVPVIKINGTSGFIEKQKIRLGLGCNSPIEQSKDGNSRDLALLINSYLKLKGEKPSAISFAWEMNTKQHRIIELAKAKLLEADTIVIIGYSFPTFNKEVDKQLFSELAQGRKTFVIQDVDKELPNRKAQLERLIGIEGGEMIHLDPNLAQFHIPLEL